MDYRACTLDYRARSWITGLVPLITEPDHESQSLYPWITVTDHGLQCVYPGSQSLYHGSHSQTIYPRVCFLGERVRSWVTESEQWIPDPLALRLSSHFFRLQKEDCFDSIFRVSRTLKWYSECALLTTEKTLWHGSIDTRMKMFILPSMYLSWHVLIDSRLQHLIAFASHSHLKLYIT